ncbi:MAG TPA: TIGR04255 family protein, partial [Urbifossiella sp.]|nr:TIGR04255 family protein [Urbifossiella sp.]
EAELPAAAQLAPMSDSPEFCPTFERPPVIETRIGVQFSPLVGFRSGHFGLFWDECLGTEGWRIREDAPPLPVESERFGDKRLQPPPDDDFEDCIGLRMRLSSADNTRTVQFQPNRLLYGWTRESGQPPSFAEVKHQFSRLYDGLALFAAGCNLGKPQANLWEVTYVNQIPPGKLWKNPSDWHRVFPHLFVEGGPSVAGHEWATFNGEWYFVIPPQLGRVRVRVQKSVNPADEVVLLLVVTARGEIGSDGASDWQTGAEIGHRSAVRVFYDLASPEARDEWGARA